MPDQHVQESKSDRLERAARAAWSWAEKREQRHAKENGRHYKLVAWDDAHEVDRAEYREYIGVVLEALDGTAVCECGHPAAEHVESGWGPHTVCVEKLPGENEGWYGVCPCVRRGEAFGG